MYSVKKSSSSSSVLYFKDIYNFLLAQGFYSCRNINVAYDFVTKKSIDAHFGK